MPEPTLSISNNELEADVGWFLGLGRGANYSETAWSTRNQLSITKAVKSGLRMFYFPAVLPGDASAYSWSFIRPMREVTLIEGESSVALPDDCGGIEGDVMFVDSGRMVCAAVITNEQRVARLYADYPDVTGQPQYCAIRIPSTTSINKGQRSNLYVYPTADEDYTLQFQMYLNPDALSASFPYALGGTTHIETIRAACLAAAERDINNVMDGPQQRFFLERMRASVSLDRRNKAQTFGLNTDKGYNRPMYTDRSNIRVPVTFDGSDPG